MTLRLVSLILAAALLAACQPAKPGPNAAHGTTTAEQTAPSAGQTAAVATRPGFADWLAGLRTEALAAGVSGATFDRAFAGVQPNQQVLTNDSSQPEYVKPIWGYLEVAVSPERIADGRQLLAANAALLNRAARPYGVDPRYVVAIWGLESAYGVNTGGYGVIEALATLAYGSRRADLFRQQLIDALLILETGDISPADMRGSWAGAMGQTQFMPAAFRQHAVDGDGDGRRDIWRSLPDVFASTANYLSAFGWRPGESWGTEVRIPANFAWELAELDVRKPVAEWRAMAIRPIAGGELTNGAAMASIIAPAGHRGPAFVIYDNFRTILKYNNSISYALAVGNLADRIVGGGPFVASWPTGEPPLSRTDKRDLQALLAARGYDPGEIDGVIGPKSRQALRQFQREIGELPDGYPTLALLNRLRTFAAS